jgi:hypothetical protein
MRAILIDAEKRTFTEVEIEAGISEIQQLLHCDCFTVGAHLSGSLSKGFDAVYVSDDRFEDCDGPRFWFQVDADRDPPSSFPIAGFGLVAGADEWAKPATRASASAMLANRIAFTRRKFRGFKTKSKSEGLEVYDAGANH